MFALSQVIVNVSARGLKISTDINKLFSTRCMLLISNGINESFVEIDKTEFSDDCLNPDWDKKFIIGYKFSGIQNLRFDIFHSLEKVGESTVPLTELLTAKDGFTMKAIKSKNIKIGKLLIVYKEVDTTKETILMQFSGKNLDKKDLFGLSDPYLVISNVDKNGNISEVYRTEVLKQTVSPVWQPIKIRAKTLCESNHQMKLQFDCFDWDSDIKLSHKTDFIGGFTSTLEQLLNGASDENTYECINLSKLADNLESYENSGLICLDKISVVLEKSFIDYLRNGSQFHMKVAIDFTSLLKFKEFNNHKKTDSSLSTTDEQNIYNLFVKNFGQIIKQYNHQNVWMFSGFNAIFADNESNDYFELKSNQLYKNVETIIEDYESILETVKPLTKGANIETTIYRSIEYFEDIIKTDLNKNFRYFILLLMTSELNVETFKNIDSIIDKTKSKPVSIIIIDININENKEIEDMTHLMNDRKKLNKPHNIEIISIQSLKQCSDWQSLVKKSVRDIINRIPDQYIKYINEESEEQGCAKGEAQPGTATRKLS